MGALPVCKFHLQNTPAAPKKRERESAFLLTEASKYDLEDVLNKLCAKVIFSGALCVHISLALHRQPTARLAL